MTEAEFLEHQENYDGWCSSCKDFTRGDTEPDALNYNCPKCGGNSVMGADMALLDGQIAEFDEEV